MYNVLTTIWVFVFFAIFANHCACKPNAEDQEISRCETHRILMSEFAKTVQTTPGMVNIQGIQDVKIQKAVLKTVVCQKEGSRGIINLTVFGMDNDLCVRVRARLVVVIGDDDILEVVGEEIVEGIPCESHQRRI